MIATKSNYGFMHLISGFRRPIRFTDVILVFRKFIGFDGVDFGIKDQIYEDLIFQDWS